MRFYRLIQFLNSLYDHSLPLLCIKPIEVGVGEEYGGHAHPGFRFLRQDIAT